MRKSRKKGKVKPEINLIRLIDRLSCEEKCREFLERLRWPEEICCTRCGDTNLCEIAKRNKWCCLGCGYHFSVTAGTIMHDSHLPLRKWFLAVYLMVESRNGISASQLKRILGVHYKTAWYLCHRIREALAHTKIEGPTLFGIVEVDEALTGNSRKGVGRANGFMRSIVGAFHKVSRKHLDRYLEELEWRFNNRENPYIFRDAMRRIVRADTLTYRELIAGKEEGTQAA